jgi:hypothetical protein
LQDLSHPRRSEIVILGYVLEGRFFPVLRD